MDMASTIQKRMAHMKEFGKMERQTAMEKALISKVISILGFMQITKGMVKESTFMKMASNIVEILLRTVKKEEECIYIKMEIIMRDNGKITNSMGKENQSIKTSQFMKDIGNKMLKMVMVPLQINRESNGFKNGRKVKKLMK